MSQTRIKRDIPGTIEQLTENLTFLINHLDDKDPPSRLVPVERLKSYARETYQEIYQSEMMVIVSKIKTREPLTAEELQLINRFMIGDLETYAILEKHMKEWIADINQILDDLQEFKDPASLEDPESLLTLQGMCMELEHTLKDFDNYRYIQERIKRFKEFIGTDPLQLNDTQRFELADTLKNMVYDPLH